MFNLNEIIEKLKDILSQELDTAKVLDKHVSIALEIDDVKFRKLKSRQGTIPYYEVMQFLAKRNISINWFFFNQLPESLVESTSNYIVLKYQRSIITSAGGGAINDELNSTPIVIDKQLLDHINSSYKYTEVLQVFGESMEPDIEDGSLVFVDKSQVNINTPGVYIINTIDGVFVKKIQYSNNYFHMSSTHQAYKEIRLDEFTVIGQVKGVYTKI